MTTGMLARVKRWIAIGMIVLAGGCGLFQRREPSIRYSETESLMSLRAVGRPGDFALYVAGHDKPEVPVRVNNGDSIGFVRTEDGRMKAVAGPFKMDLPQDVHEAYWKRLTYLDE
jgi:hypothetical protein